MGYDGKPIGLELTIVTVVLRYGVFPSEPNGTQCVGRNGQECARIDRQGDPLHPV